MFKNSETHKSRLFFSFLWKVVKMSYAIILLGWRFASDYFDRPAIGKSKRTRRLGRDWVRKSQEKSWTMYRYNLSCHDCTAALLARTINRFPRVHCVYAALRNGISVRTYTFTQWQATRVTVLVKIHSQRKQIALKTEDYINEKLLCLNYTSLANNRMVSLFLHEHFCGPSMPQKRNGLKWCKHALCSACYSMSMHGTTAFAFSLPVCEPLFIMSCMY